MSKIRLLTDAEFKSASATDGRRREIRDNSPDAEGLALRISDRGHKSWSLRYRLIDGTQRRMTLGTFPAVGVADARERAQAIKRQAGADQDPQAAKRRARTDAKAQPVKTFGDLAEAYFTACEKGRWTPRKRVKALSTLTEERAVYTRCHCDQTSRTEALHAIAALSEIAGKRTVPSSEKGLSFSLASRPKLAVDSFSWVAVGTVSFRSEPNNPITASGAFPSVTSIASCYS